MADEVDVIVSSVEDTPLMVSVDDTGLPPTVGATAASRSEWEFFDSDGSQDIFSQPLSNSGGDCNDHLMLLDDDPAVQVPCLIPLPESVVPPSSSRSHNDILQTSVASSSLVDGDTDSYSASSATITFDITDSSVQKHAESQPFDFVNDIIRSCSPSKSIVPPHYGLHSANARNGNKLTAAEAGSLKSQKGRQTADNTDS